MWRTLRTSAHASGGAPVEAGALPDPLPESPWSRRRAAPEPGVVVLGVVAAGVALSPWVNPKLPGHSGPVDLVVVAGVGTVLLWALRARVPARLPYALPVGGLLVTGLLAGLFSAQPSDGLTAVVQEIFLLLWCAAVATVCRTPSALGLLLRVWVASSVAWAALLIAIEVVGVREVLGTSLVGPSAGGPGTRAQLLFDQPNMAGNYFMVAVFVLLAAGWPRRWWVRGALGLVLLTAQFLTGSNAALVSLLGAGVLTLFLHLRGRAGVVGATAVTAATAAVLGVVLVAAAPLVVDYARNSDDALLQNSVGRGPRSAAARSSLFEWQFRLYEQGDLLGIGPNGTQRALGAQAAPAVKEAHNDYLGTLVERGPLGLASLALLVGVVVARAAAATGRPPPPRLAPVVPAPAALAGACAAFAITASTHETLHYRWLWTLLGLLAALHLLARPAVAGPAAVPGRQLALPGARGDD